MDIDQNEPQNLTGQLKFTSKEQCDFKADELNYEIEAIQLNKIDEESIESSSRSTFKEISPIKDSSESIEEASEKYEDNTPVAEKTMKHKSKSLTDIHNHAQCKADFDEHALRLVQKVKDDKVVI